MKRMTNVGILEQCLKKTSYACPLEYSFSKYAFHFGNMKCLKHEAALQGNGNSLRFQMGRWKFNMWKAFRNILNKTIENFYFRIFS